MWPLQALDRVIYAGHQLRDRRLHRELARLDAVDEPALAAETFVHDMYETWYSPAPDPHPHVTT
ncbi:hypothetical protein [Streptomyces platensis]|uniref:hypothetical protein n=1 Tax=Streptomyces platensis TaxID=58346 RepID=UPI00332623B1